MLYFSTIISIIITITIIITTTDPASLGHACSLRSEADTILPWLPTMGDLHQALQLVLWKTPPRLKEKEGPPLQQHILLRGVDIYYDSLQINVFTDILLSISNHLQCHWLQNLWHRFSTISSWNLSVGLCLSFTLVSAVYPVDNVDKMRTGNVPPPWYSIT